MKSTRLSLPILFIACAALLAVLAFITDGVEGRTITVDDDGGADYEKIQDAIDNATDGDTVRVWEGVYYENVVVNKSVDLVGNGSEGTTIDAGGSGDVVKIMADWVNMSGFSVTGSGNWGSNSGIEVESDNDHIFENNCSSNRNGIYLDGSSECTVTNNTCSNNDYGINLWDSSECKITSNTCSNNRYGIVLDGSSECKITNNSCSNNNSGISLDGSSECKIENNTCSNNDYGIRLSGSSDCNITNNTCSANNNYGIYLWISSDCTIENNNGTIEVENYDDDEGFLPGFGAALLLLALFVFMGRSPRKKGKPPVEKDESGGVDEGRQE